MPQIPDQLNEDCPSDIWKTKEWWGIREGHRDCKRETYLQSRKQSSAKDQMGTMYANRKTINTNTERLWILCLCAILPHFMAPAARAGNASLSLPSQVSYLHGEIYS